jgi:hypothetical protein
MVRLDVFKGDMFFFHIFFTSVTRIHLARVRTRRRRLRMVEIEYLVNALD